MAARNRLGACSGALLAALTLGACGRTEAPPAPQAVAVAPEAPPPPRVIAVNGVVVALQRSPSLVTLQQEASAQMGWQALTIGYPASPEVMATVKVGDRIALDLELAAGGYIVGARQLPPATG